VRWRWLCSLPPRPSPTTWRLAQTLDTLNVRASRDAKTEGSGNYGAKATTLFKGVQSIRQTPQPVTVISRQLLDDRALLDLHDVLLLAGVSASALAVMERSPLRVRAHLGEVFHQQPIGLLALPHVLPQHPGRVHSGKPARSIFQRMPTPTITA